jgi:hypothetical protein
MGLAMSVSAPTPVLTMAYHNVRVRRTICAAVTREAWHLWHGPNTGSRSLMRSRMQLAVATLMEGHPHKRSLSRRNTPFDRWFWPRCPLLYPTEVVQFTLSL